MFRLRPKLEVKLNGAISDVQFKPSALRAKEDERLTLNHTYVHLSFIKLSIGGVKTSGNGFEFSEAFLFVRKAHYPDILILDIYPMGVLY